jgi:hypothetical protein
VRACGGCGLGPSDFADGSKDAEPSCSVVLIQVNFPKEIDECHELGTAQAVARLMDTGA